MIEKWLVEKSDSEIPIRNATFLRRPIEPGLKPSAWATEHVYPVILRRNGVHCASDSPSSDKPSLGSEFGCKIRVPEPVYPGPERWIALEKVLGIHTAACFRDLNDCTRPWSFSGKILWGQEPPVKSPQDWRV